MKRLIVVAVASLSLTGVANASAPTLAQQRLDRISRIYDNYEGCVQHNGAAQCRGAAYWMEQVVEATTWTPPARP